MATKLDDPQNASVFIERLVETIVWCSHHASPDDPQNSLRTLKPAFLTVLNMPEHLVFSIALQRGRELGGLGLTYLKPGPALGGGRLLAFDPSMTLSDGAAALESQGFFDYDNIPPYDTWVAFIYDEPFAHYLLAGSKGHLPYFMHYLIAWVPPQFLPLAAAGIRVNPEECIRWLDELDRPFVHALRRHHILT